ncbi:hypothetical protein Tco_0469147 [Tanacetum coccineum]
MAEEQEIVYAPQWNNMTVDNVTFQTNNVVGNFNYPPNVPAYKPIMKFLLNCPLNKAFTNCLSVLYHNYLKEFWSIVVVYDPFPSNDETEQCLLRKFLIKFSILNGQRPLTLDFNTFCSSNGLDYNNGKYVAHPTPKAVKKELGKIAINPSYLDKTSVLKNSFPMAWRILFSFVIQVDIGEIIYSDLVTKLLNKSKLKYVSYPRFISCALQVLLGSDYTQDARFGYLPAILSNSNFTKDPSKVTEIELTAYIIVVNNQRDLMSPLPLSTKPKKGKSHSVTPTLPKSQGPEASEALFKKIKKPKSKKTPAETKATSTPKPTEGSEQSHSVSSGTAWLNTPCPEGTLEDKDSEGNKPPADMELINPSVADLSDIGAKYQLDTQPLVLSNYADVRAFLLSDDEAQESEEEILGADKPTSSTAPHTEESDFDSIDPKPDRFLREGKGIATDEQVEDQRKLVKASSIICSDPDALIPYTINREVYYLTAEQLQAHMDKEDQIKKAEEEARLFAMSKPKLIKVVREEAKKLGIHPKEAITTKAGEKFKKGPRFEH